MSRLLNIGGGDKSIALPDYYLEHEHVLLDVMPGHGVDIVGDARELSGLVEPASFDVVYAAHFLEHCYEADGMAVLRAARTVLVSGGMLEVRVPDLRAVFERIARGAGLLDVVQHCARGPIRAVDVLFGDQDEIAAGRVFMAHRYGFDAESLWTAVTRAGYHSVSVGRLADTMELWARGIA